MMDTGPFWLTLHIFEAHAETKTPPHYSRFWGCFLFVNAQGSFVDVQKSVPKLSEVYKRVEDTLQKQFEAKKLVWPARYVYLRSFKYDSQLEIWVKNEWKDQYKLFKTYKVCALGLFRTEAHSG
jgi:hypothetical protein